jgi:type III secretory pathway lipoprotein EscJ
MDLSSQVSQIKYLAAGSIRDLQYEAISVYLFPSAAVPLMPLPPKVPVLGITVDPADETLTRVLVLAAFTLIAGGAFLGVRRFIFSRGGKNQEQGA